MATVYKIRSYSYKSQSEANRWATDFKNAFDVTATVESCPSGGFQVVIDNQTNATKAKAVSAVIGKSMYNEVSSGSVSILSYMYSLKADAELWAKNVVTACGSGKYIVGLFPGKNAYQYRISGINNTTKVNALGRVMGKALYNELTTREESGGVGSKTLPLRNNYSWNQFGPAVLTALNQNDAGCLYCCALAVANLYGTRAYTPADMTGDAYWNQNGWTGTMPCKAKIDYTVTPFSFSKVKSEIDQNRYIIIKMDGGKDQHYVVAYGYKNGCNAAADILVIDSADAQNSASDIGVLRTLSASMSYNHHDHLAGYRLTRP